MKCNGCGGEFDVLGGVFSYGSATEPHPPDYAQHFPDGEIADMVQAEYHKTLCPRCQHVMFDILKNSDLKDQWDNYNWSLKGGPYTEPYDG